MLTQTIPILEQFIHIFVTSTSKCFPVLLVLAVDASPLAIKVHRVTLVTLVSDEPLITLQQTNNTIQSYLQIIPLTRRAWTIDPNNVTCLDADTHFTSKTWPIKLLRTSMPFWIPNGWILNAKVRTINTNQTPATIVIIVSVLPLNLQCQQFQNQRKHHHHQYQVVHWHVQS